MRTALFFALLACNDETADPLDPTSPQDTSAASGCDPTTTPLDIRWRSCSLDPAGDDGLAECADVEVPLFWCDPDDERTLTVAVKRFRNGGEAQMWYLQGGPGASGVASLHGVFGDLGHLPWDFYSLDHRGVGGSSRLSCPVQEASSSDEGEAVTVAESEACGADLVAQWGDALDGFTTTASASDVAAIVAAERTRGQEVFVWGGSYGSYIGHRYLQVAPDQPSGVVLEGVVPPGTSFHDAPLHHDATAQKLLDRCREDTFCRERLGDDPWATTQDVIRRVREEGHCPDLGVAQDPRRILLYMAYYGGWNALIPAMVYRLDRCEEADRAAWQIADARVQGFVSGVVDWPLNWHVKASEMYGLDELPSAEELDEWAESCTICASRGSEILDLLDVWPAYPPSDLLGAFAETAAPLLMLQGALDPASPVEESQVMQTVFARPDQHFLVFESTAHNVRGGAPTNFGGGDCATAIYQHFVEKPEAELDTSCLTRLAPLDFEGDPEWATFFMGTPDAWEG